MGRGLSVCSDHGRIFPAPYRSGELWNIPKFFVEFGMILTLLESEIITTSRQREEYRVLFDGNPLPMWITEVHSHNFLKVNRWAILQYGYSEDEFLSMSLADISIPKLHPNLTVASRVKVRPPSSLVPGPT